MDIPKCKITKIETEEDVSDEEFLEDCSFLGHLADGLMHIKESIEDCGCIEVQKKMDALRKRVKKEYPTIIQYIKDMEMEKAYKAIDALIGDFAELHMDELKKHIGPALFKMMARKMDDDERMLN